MDSVSTDPQSLFIGRDASWLSFNRRVLEEAQDPDNPLLERVKFLAITASNLDEFVEIRVAGIMQRIEDGYTEPGFDGLTPRQTLDIVVQDMHTFVRDQYRCWTEDLRPALYDNGVRVLEWAGADDAAVRDRAPDRLGFVRIVQAKIGNQELHRCARGNIDGAR